MTYLQILNLLMQILLVAMAVPPLRTSKFYEIFLILVNQKGKKPLDCAVCLTMWTALLLHLFLWKVSFPMAMLAALATAWLGNETDKIFERL